MDRIIREYEQQESERAQERKRNLGNLTFAQLIGAQAKIKENRDASSTSGAFKINNSIRKIQSQFSFENNLNDNHEQGKLE